MEAFGNCPAGTGSAAAYYTESGVVPNGITTVGWGCMNVTRDFQTFTRTVTRIVKCAERSDPHCENWQVWTFGGERTCHDIERQDLPWSAMFRALPRFKCPMKKVRPRRGAGAAVVGGLDRRRALFQGLYRQQNATFDLDRMALVDLGVIALARNYWKVRMEVDMDNIRMLNLCFEMSASRVRAS
ncbi:hypothetical protein ONE63_001396 [Megalurothrips usitatus]|uniref:Uncharacterized protein n=1 Tax=Megalurothrips usitatus TaxID=439358 RepID=A0AAV7XG63_9NEOP|nr:hypothetical protein ONE63_001396 [Megalurothrips usitatus]